MSKRRGIFITLEDLIQEIDPGIVRFFFLQKSTEAIIEFDLDLAKKESEENPYWYVQYAYARLNSILEKAGKKPNIDPQKVFLSIKDIESVKTILRKIHQFQDLIYLIYKEKRVNLVAEYLISLAKKIHSFYEKERILPDRRKIAFVYFLREFLGFVLLCLQIKPVKKI